MRHPRIIIAGIGLAAVAAPVTSSPAQGTVPATPPGGLGY